MQPYTLPSPSTSSAATGRAAGPAGPGLAKDPALRNSPKRSGSRDGEALDLQAVERADHGRNGVELSPRALTHGDAIAGSGRINPP